MKQPNTVTVIAAVDAKCKLKDGERIVIAELKNVDREALLARRAKYNNKKGPTTEGR